MPDWPDPNKGGCPFEKFKAFVDGRIRCFSMADLDTLAGQAVGYSTSHVSCNVGELRQAFDKHIAEDHCVECKELYDDLLRVARDRVDSAKDDE